MSNQKYFWHGEPVKTDFGYATVQENKEKPLFWYNFECLWNLNEGKPYYGTKKSAMIPTIKVTSKDGQSFLIANHFGIGASKLKKGGWPNHIHFSLPDNAKFEGCEDLGVLRNIYSIREFDEEKFAEHEKLRGIWQKENFPEETKKMDNLKAMFRKGK